MAKKKPTAGGKDATPPIRTMPPRSRFIVLRAALIGTNWTKKAVSSSLYEMDGKFMHDLGFMLTSRKAFIVGPAKPNGAGWTDLVCWPGRGMFVAALSLEEAK